MRKIFMALVLFLLTLSLAGCEPSPGKASGPGPESEPPSQTAGTESEPVGTEPDTEPTVQTVAFYEHISLADGESVDVLDIDDGRVLFAVCAESGTENNDFGNEKTTALAIYDTKSGQVTPAADLTDELVYVYHGRLIGDDFVYSAASVEQSFTDKDGYVRRCGGSSWEYQLSGLTGDGEMVPMPFVFPSGAVAFIDAGGLYDEANNDGKLAATWSSRMKAVLISPDGTEKTLFEPEDEKFLAYTHLLPYQDKCMFRMQSERGFEIYALDENGTELLLTIDDCRAVYPWWVEAEDGFLFLIGYGDDQAGITSINNVLISEGGATVMDDGRQYSRLTSDQKGSIMATDLSWRRFVLRIEGERMTATRIDLPKLPGEFYYDEAAGKMYVHLNDPKLGDVGLYEVAA